MGKVILACSSLTDYIDLAQKKLQTDHQVIYLDRKNHLNPLRMNELIAETLAALPDNTDTVLVCMGYCGGSWEKITVPCRVVIPRVDDCVSLLLQTDDNYHPNLKQRDHLYMKDKNPQDFSLIRAFEGWTAKMTPEEKEKTRRAWTAIYNEIDIVDTGMYDCHSEMYIAEAQRNAEWINGIVKYVSGSNRIIEKLLLGKWDCQFFVAEAGQTITKYDLLSEC